jgi:hypothetical protein
MRFEEQIAARMDGLDGQNKQEPQQAECGAGFTRKATRKLNTLDLSDLSADCYVGEAQVLTRSHLIQMEIN